MTIEVHFNGTRVQEPFAALAEYMRRLEQAEQNKPKGEGNG